MTQIRRVPLDFDWPLNKVWEGYLLPEHLRLPPCPACNHDGYQASGLSREAWAIEESFYALDVPEPVRSRIAWHDKITQAEVDHLLKKGRLSTWEPDPDGAHGRWVSAPRTAAEVNAAQHGSMLDGHDGLNRWLLVKYRCKRLRIDMNCPTCGGTTHVGTPEQVAAREAWSSYDPPTGEGYQVWEDISEGSPISPVFSTRLDLIDWLTGPASASASSRYPLTRREAEALVKAGGSVGSFVVANGEFLDGDRAVAALDQDGV